LLLYTHHICIALQAILQQSAKPSEYCPELASNNDTSFIHLLNTTCLEHAHTWPQLTRISLPSRYLIVACTSTSLSLCQWCKQSFQLCPMYKKLFCIVKSLATHICATSVQSNVVKHCKYSSYLRNNHSCTVAVSYVPICRSLSLSIHAYFHPHAHQLEASLDSSIEELREASFLHAFGVPHPPFHTQVAHKAVFVRQFNKDCIP
jgi:hypothetical protein